MNKLLRKIRMGKRASEAEAGIVTIALLLFAGCASLRQAAPPPPFQFAHTTFNGIPWQPERTAARESARSASASVPKQNDSMALKPNFSSRTAQPTHATRPTRADRSIIVKKANTKPPAGGPSPVVQVPDDFVAYVPAPPPPLFPLIPPNQGDSADSTPGTDQPQSSADPVDVWPGPVHSMPADAVAAPPATTSKASEAPPLSPPNIPEANGNAVDAAADGAVPAGVARSPLKALATTGAGLDPESTPSASQRQALVASATRLLGVRDTFDPLGFIQHLFKIQHISVSGWPSDGDLRDLFRSLKSASSERNPKPGDLIFFHNTEDLDHDGRQNDWYTLVGVIEAVDRNRTITFIAPVNGEIVRRVVTIGQPQLHRDAQSGKVLNSYLRERELQDPEYAQYLAGELFAGTVALPH